MALSGYQGWDRILTRAQLSRLVARGVIRFFLIPTADTRGAAGFPGGFPGRFRGGDLPNGFDTNLNSVNDGLMTWVRTTCTAVPTSKYQSIGSGKTGSGFSGPGGFSHEGPGELYGCSTGDKPG